MLGQTGDSGNIKGGTPHLHFGISWPTDPGIWWVRRGEVKPWPYLDAWLAGKAMSPKDAVKASHAAVGDGPCTVYC
jgi:murein DD-endopeptidase MepM/ murein hydrolase activator NlpD